MEDVSKDVRRVNGNLKAHPKVEYDPVVSFFSLDVKVEHPVLAYEKDLLTL